MEVGGKCGLGKLNASLSDGEKKRLARAVFHNQTGVQTGVNNMGQSNLRGKALRNKLLTLYFYSISAIRSRLVEPGLPNGTPAAMTIN